MQNLICKLGNHKWNKTFEFLNREYKVCRRCGVVSLTDVDESGKLKP